MTQLLQSEAFWLALGPILAWATQTYLTPLVAKLPPTGWWRRIIRRAHGILNTIDPEGNSCEKK